MNEVAALSEEYGVEVEQVLEGIALDPRIGSSYMRPSLGFGGSCLPKELQVLASAGRRRGLPMHVARAIGQVNVEQQDRFVRRILGELPDEGARVGLLGLSSRPIRTTCGDPRPSTSPAPARKGTRSSRSTPPSDRTARSTAAPGIVMAATAADVFEDADAVVIGTEWPQFAQLPLGDLRTRMRQPFLFDGRGLIDPSVATEAGLSYRGVGRRPRDPASVKVS